ncbi:MAG: gamma carbonic anhydrase family protein [Candidatus Krumholzibacteria bacterium]|nr:gamma carbonic anhydrase family protein [Candidatus Krumholzibacteria bacterium]
MIEAFQGSEPSIGADVYIAPSADVIGDVVIHNGASVWHGAVLRGDCWRIVIGRYSNVQDRCVCHCTTGGPDLVIGDHVTVGHGAVLHSCTVEDGSLIGMGAVVLDGALIGAGSIVAAGCVVLEGTVVPPRSLVAGVPGAVRRPVDDRTAQGLIEQARAYHRLASSYIGAGVFELPERNG